MRKIIILACLWCVFLSVFGADSADKSKFTPYGFVGFYGGTSTFLGEYNVPFRSPNTFSIPNNTDWGAALAFGGYFSSVIGLRGEVGYAQNRWMNLQGPRCEFWFTTFTGDLMVNLSNWATGYNPKRIFDFKVFVGVGVGVTNCLTNSNWNNLMTPVYRVGMEGTFHVARRLDLDVSIDGNAVNDNYNGVNNGFPLDVVVSTMIGVIYHFPASAATMHARRQPILENRQPAKPQIEQPVLAKKAEPIDTDGDGIPDSEDQCPTVKGVAKYHGCPVPDTDGDGVDDEHDKCPTIPGPVENNGCPVVKQETVLKLNQTAKRVFFFTGSADLKFESKIALIEVVKVLDADPNLKLTINGYTDNVGNPALNQALSEKRAAVVRNFLITNGIDPDRLRSAGYGQTKPVASNSTDIGRQLNRRVELLLTYAF